jgi:indolepyruvate ferredoxin oxidoreductase beta subunit
MASKNQTALKSKAHDPALDQIIKLAIMAVGGQGGGVLTNWIEDCAHRNGYVVQATSVAGVAQRTGATIYYMEMAPARNGLRCSRLMPAAGDVDILIAAEMMEAGRAIMRGFVTPDRTTLIASSHRALAVSEKMVPGDGIANSEEVIAAAEIAAQRFICLRHGQDGCRRRIGDLGQPVRRARRVRRPALRAREFRGRDQGVRPRRRGQSPGFRRRLRGCCRRQWSNGPSRPAQAPVANAPAGPKLLVEQWSTLEARAMAMPDAARDMALTGLRAVVDFQDLDYGAEYLDRLERCSPRTTRPRVMS